jgi:hypothetical protein
MAVVDRSAAAGPDAHGNGVEPAWLARRRWAWLACAALAVIAFAPVLRGYYLHTDDYFWSPYGGFTAAEIMKFMTMVGRPVAGALFWGFSQWPGGMSSMNLLRLVSVLNLACLAYMYVRWLTTWGLAPLAALGIAIVAITQPAFQTYAAYLCTGVYGLAFSLGAAGALMTHRAIETAEPRRRRRRFAIAWLAWLAAVATYQPAPFLVFALLAVPLLVTEPAALWARWRGPALRYAAVFAAALATYYALWRIWARFATLPYLGKYDNRALLHAEQIPERLSWFVHGVLLDAMSFWKMFPSAVIQVAVVGVVALCAIADFDRRAPGCWLAKYLVIAACGALCFAPSLLSAGPSLEYRTYAAVSTFWVMVLLVGAVRAVRRWPAAARAAPAVCVALALVGTFWAGKTVTEFFATPDGLEFMRVRHELTAFQKAHPGAPIRYVHVIPTPTALVVARERHEFAEPSVRHPPNIRPIVLAALAERGIRDRPRISVQVGDRWVEWGDRLSGMELPARQVAPSDPAETVVVDMRDLVLY